MIMQDHRIKRKQTYFHSIANLKQFMSILSNLKTELNCPPPKKKIVFFFSPVSNNLHMNAFR